MCDRTVHRPTLKATFLRLEWIAKTTFLSWVGSLPLPEVEKPVFDAFWLAVVHF